VPRAVPWRGDVDTLRRASSELKTKGKDVITRLKGDGRESIGRTLLSRWLVRSSEEVQWVAGKQVGGAQSEREGRIDEREPQD
jgi:hypothetical protein